MWTDQVIEKLSDKKVYRREDLFRFFKRERGDIAESTCRWVLYNLQKKQELFRIGYDSYMTVKPEALPVYKPVYSKNSLALIKKMRRQYPSLCFVVFESLLLNECLNHQIAQNTIYIQVDKDINHYVFDELRDWHAGVVLYRPDRSEFDRYWTRDCIVVLDLISQYPACVERPHEIVPEKMLVDIIADKSIAATFSPSELPTVYKHFFDNYQIDKRRLNRYAGRRGKVEIVKQYIGEP